MLARRVEEAPALLRRNPPPDVPGGEHEADRPGAAAEEEEWKPWHDAILAHRAVGEAAAPVSGRSEGVTIARALVPPDTET